MNKLIRALSLKQAISLNVIDMVGIGPFITIPFVIGAMHGPACLLAWALGALLAFADGSVWAELGAKWPAAGGSYVFLHKLFGNEKLGRLMSFLYIWQTIIQAPLVVASGAIGFAQYLTFLIPMPVIAQKAVSGSVVILLVILLYREVKFIGRISVFMGAVVITTILWMIFSAVGHFKANLAFTFPPESFNLNTIFFLGMGQASIKTVYSFLGYYNVCHLGSEIKNPEKNIPKSIFVSITIIAILYILMQLAVLGTIPWQVAKDSTFIVSLYFERIYGHGFAMMATGLVLFIAFTSLFAVLVGYSRVPYAAAAEGRFLAVFGKLHPTKNFPHYSLLIIGGLGFLFSLLFKMKEIITAIIVMRIIVQFIGQSVGLIIYHNRNPNAFFPFRMSLFPVPAIIAIFVWLFIFFSADWVYILAALGIICSGIATFLLHAKLESEKPAQG